MSKPVGVDWKWAADFVADWKDDPDSTNGNVARAFLALDALVGEMAEALGAVCQILPSLNTEPRPGDIGRVNNRPYLDAQNQRIFALLARAKETRGG